MDYITQFHWRHLAFGFVFCDLHEHRFVELHGGQVYLLWSFLLILVIAPGVSIYAFDTLIKRLINALARTSFWVLNYMSDVWTLWYNTRMHWYAHWTFLGWLCDWISLNFRCINVCIGFAFGILNLSFMRHMDIHAYLLMPMTTVVTIGMIKTLVKLWWLHWRIVKFGIDFLSIAHAFTMISGQPIDELLSCVSGDVTAVTACLLAKN